MVDTLQPAPTPAPDARQSAPSACQSERSEEPPHLAPALARPLLPTPYSLLPASEGFTLLELLIVMVIIATLAAIAVPAYTRNVQAAKEAVLKEDLHVMRQAIDSYTVDKQKAPQSLQDLVQAGYLKAMPKDPITNRTDTWNTTQSDTLNSIDQTASGIDDVHSGAQQASLEGTSYSTW